MGGSRSCSRAVGEPGPGLLLGQSGQPQASLPGEFWQGPRLPHSGVSWPPKEAQAVQADGVLACAQLLAISAQ